MDLHQRRQAEFEKYRKVYRDFPRYTNRQLRIDLTREWIQANEFEGPLPTSLLDVGAGRGEVVRMANAVGVHAVGCEVIAELCVGADPIGLMDGAHDLPYRSAAFDLVTCTDVMEHILEDDVPAALHELARVTRGPVLLTICHIHDRPGKYGPDTLHITVKGRPWWIWQIRKNMDPVAIHVLYSDRVNQNGTWFEILCG